MRFFPDPTTAAADGFVHVTETMNPEMVLEAYRHGLFPWSASPIRWFSPDPRAVFELDHVHLSHSLKKELRAGRYRVTFDTSFADVMKACAEAHAEQRIWIGDVFVTTYTELHRRGYAHSVEVWNDDALVGGSYGIQIGAYFAGESMFHRADNASKIAFAYLVRQLAASGVVLFDTQVLNNHTRSLGAVEIPRAAFLSQLERALATPVVASPWPQVPAPWGTESSNTITTPAKALDLAHRTAFAASLHGAAPESARSSER